ncbi:unnamed protein product [Lupinus luteus]|uniref:Charged multivesicular body protein 5 n=1 Tax=Lupinus luteus TaxID=3873 RepID=A0AAV1XJ94_LUPLU
MKSVFGGKKNNDPPPSIQDASNNITKRGDTVEEKIKKLHVELNRYKEQIKKTRPGPAQEAVKARAMRALKQKRTYEGQRDMLYNQTFNLDQVHSAAVDIKDAQQTNLQDEMTDLMDASNEIEKTLGRSYNVPDDIDEDGLLGEHDALKADMGDETEADSVPSYLQPDKEPDLDAELNLPSASAGHTAPGRSNAQAEDKPGLPAVPGALLRG